MVHYQIICLSFLAIVRKGQRYGTTVVCRMSNQQVLANEDASPFFHSFLVVVLVVVVVIVIMVVKVVVLAFDWGHVNHH